jgi:hypothetical protein
MDLFLLVDGWEVLVFFTKEDRRKAVITLFNDRERSREYVYTAYIHDTGEIIPVVSDLKQFVFERDKADKRPRYIRKSYAHKTAEEEVLGLIEESWLEILKKRESK